MEDPAPLRDQLQMADATAAQEQRPQEDLYGLQFQQFLKMVENPCQEVVRSPQKKTCGSTMRHASGEWHGEVVLTNIHYGYTTVYITAETAMGHSIGSRIKEDSSKPRSPLTKCVKKSSCKLIGGIRSNDHKLRPVTQVEQQMEPRSQAFGLDFRANHVTVHAKLCGK